METKPMTQAEFFAFVERTTWKEAKTYSKTFPHEYIMRDKALDTLEWDRAAAFINANGIKGFFFKKVYIYIYTRNLKFWVIEDCMNRDSAEKKYG